MSVGHQTIGEATATRDKTPAALAVALAVALQPHYVSDRRSHLMLMSLDFLNPLLHIFPTWQ
jgi:hypothetical protein